MTPACEDREMALGALVDAELDAVNTALTEAHVARCEGCRAEVERLEALRRLLRADGVRHGASDALRQRVLASPELAMERAAPKHRLPGWMAPGLAGALAASLASVMILSPVQQEASLDRQLISSHVRSLQPGHLIDVQTSNQHVVKPWFNGKVDFAPPVPELADAGFPLAGGRLDSLNGKTVAAIVYHRRLHSVNLYVWRDADAPSKSSVDDGFALNEWSEGGLRFAAVSDIPADELRQFARIYQQRSGLRS